MNQHETYLRDALELAKIRRGFCAPNPSVGAVIVLGNSIIEKGYHHAPGAVHAEVDVLTKIKNLPKDATLYITLEPCCHIGKTPPCTEAIIKSGIKKVIYGYVDPHSIVNGKGHETLKNAGIKCELVPLPEIAQFYESYHYWHQTKKPFVTAKIAMTLDGKIAGPNGEPIQITSSILNEYTHEWRKNSDAILTTAKTIKYDNPQLNARLKNKIEAKKLFILDTNLNLPLESRIFSTAESITVFHSKNVKKRQQILTEQGVNCVSLDEGLNGLNLAQAIEFIGESGVHDLWVEAGGICFTGLLQDNLLQRALIYVAPHVLTEGRSAFHSNFDFRSKSIHWRQMGQDVLCEVRW